MVRASRSREGLTVLDVAADQLLFVRIVIAAPLPVVVVVELQGCSVGTV